MKVKVATDLIYFTIWTLLGLGYEKTIGIFRIRENILEVHYGCSKYLPKMLKNINKYYPTRRPINVMYW